MLQSLPLPALIDIDFVGEDRARHMGQLRALVAREAPGARIIPHAEWLGPVARLIRSLAWVAGGFIILVVGGFIAASALPGGGSKTAGKCSHATLESIGLDRK